MPASIKRCSIIGPSAYAGKNVSAPTMMITPMSKAEKSGPSVGKVPAPAGTIFFFTTEGTMVVTSLDYFYTTQPVATALDVPKLG